MSKYGVGLKNVGSYMVSGHPFMTGNSIQSVPANPQSQAEKQVVFPFVTKKVTVFNTSTSAFKKLRVHFASTGSQNGSFTGTTRYGNHHFITVPHGGSVTLDVRCSSIWISGGALNGGSTYGPMKFTYQFQVYASLTNIPTGSMYDLTGSGISE